MRLLSVAGAFILAMWAIGAGWTAARAVWEAPSAARAAGAALYAAVFLGAFVYLGFWVYAADRAAGKVRRTIGVYERILRRKDSRA